MTGLEEVERDHILRALNASNRVVGGRNGAPARLRMHRTTLAYRIRKLRIGRPSPQPAIMPPFQNSEYFETPCSEVSY
jgi:formate hydrogenlyase transcriptional activator